MINIDKVWANTMYAEGLIQDRFRAENVPLGFVYHATNVVGPGHTFVRTSDGWTACDIPKDLAEAGRLPFAVIVPTSTPDTPEIPPDGKGPVSANAIILELRAMERRRGELLTQRGICGLDRDRLHDLAKIDAELDSIEVGVARIRNEVLLWRPLGNPIRPDMRIDDHPLGTGFSVRTENTLKMMGVRTFEDLLTCDPTLDRSCTRRFMREVFEAAERHGVLLPMFDPARLKKPTKATLHKAHLKSQKKG